MLRTTLRMLPLYHNRLSISTDHSQVKSSKPRSTHHTCHQVLNHLPTQSSNLVSSLTQILTVTALASIINNSPSMLHAPPTRTGTSNVMAQWHFSIKALDPTTYLPSSPSNSVNVPSTLIRLTATSQATRSPSSPRSVPKTSTLLVLSGKESGTSQLANVSSATSRVT